MLQTLLSSLISGITDALFPIIQTFMDMLNFDLDQFVTFFPAASVLYNIVRSIALGLVLGIAIVNILKFFISFFGKATESPFMVLGRTFLAVFMVFFGNYILELVVDLFKGPYSSILNSYDPAGWSNAWDTIKDGVTNPLTYGTTIAIGELGSLLLSTFILIALGINLLKLLLELVERYVMVGVLVYTGPLGWCTLASQNTMQIFSRWINMFISQCLMMLISAWSVRLTISILTENSSSFLIKGIFALAFTRLAQRFDSYIQQLGLNPATTGGNILDEIVAAGQMFRKATGGKSGGGGGGSGSGDSNPLGSTGFTEGNAVGRAAAFGVFAGGGRVVGNAARGAKAEYTAARAEGMDFMTALRSAGKQAANNAKASVIPGKGGDNYLESQAREANARARNGDTEMLNNQTITMQRYAATLAEKDGEVVPTPSEKSAKKFENNEPLVLNEAATKRGLSVQYKKGANGEVNTNAENGYIAGRTEADAAKFAKTNLESGAEFSNTEKTVLNNTVRNLNNANNALGIDTDKIAAADENLADRVWASSMISAGAGDMPAESMPAGFDKALAEMSDGTQGDIDQNGGIEMQSSWQQSVSAGGGYNTKFTYTTPAFEENGEMIQDVYNGVVMDETEYKRLAKSKALTSDTKAEERAIADNAVRIQDKAGTTRYISFQKETRLPDANSGSAFNHDSPARTVNAPESDS